MKNLLLLTILLGTIACNGSDGNGPLKIDPETNQIIQEVEHYSAENFEIPCEEVDSDTLLKTCLPVTTSTDTRALEGLETIYEGGVNFNRVEHEGEGIKFVYSEPDRDYLITLLEDGKIGVNGYFFNQWSWYYNWRVENEELIITQTRYISTNGEGWRSPEIVRTIPIVR